ncbi:MAG TPA: hypothetical protein VJX67_05715 [Blastocatellia bacterium]|nr:hypothetical protein [Blastocatellia bacterium]
MIRRCITSAVIGSCLLFLAAFVQAQDRTLGSDDQVQPAPANPVEDVATYDDDGGRVFILRRDSMRPLADLHFHGGKVMAAPRQYTIFLGSGWSTPWNKAKAAQVRHNVASAVSGVAQSADGPVLASHGVGDISVEPDWQQDPIVLNDSNGGTVSDLQIQEALSESFASGVIGAPDQDTIYTVFLPPGSMSTLGGLLGGKHYLAYHNFFHIDGVEIRYVVVPFQGNGRLARSVVRRALIEAILNPSGDGWF